MKPFLKICLFFALGLAFAPAAGAADFFELRPDFTIKVNCEKYFRELELKGSVIPRETLNVPRMRQEKFLVSKLPDPPESAIYIGVANHKETNEGIHHYYLVAGKRRLEAKPIFGKVQGMGGVLSKGVVFRVPVSPDVVEKLEARLNGKSLPRGITCLHVLCKILDEGGVTIDGVGGPGQPVRAKAVVASLLEGKIHVNGEAVDTATMKLFESHEGELNHFLSNALSVDESMRAQVVSDLSTKAMFVVLAATGVPVVVLLLPHHQAAAK